VAKDHCRLRLSTCTQVLLESKAWVVLKFIRRKSKMANNWDKGLLKVEEETPKGKFRADGV